MTPHWIEADDFHTKVARIAEATDFLPAAAAFALGYCDGDETAAYAYLWSLADPEVAERSTPPRTGVPNSSRLFGERHQ